MENTIVFSKVKREDIFCETFDQFEKNNVIHFSNAGIAVIYGPNGVGKTSLTRVLDCEEASSFNVEFEGKQYNEKDNELFHIINDQNSRNIIAGETEDFLLGDDIKKEYDLQRYIDKEFTNLFVNKLSITLKKEFNISKKSSELLKQVVNSILREYIGDLSNSKSKGNEIDRNQFLTYVSNIEEKDVPEYDIKKYEYTIRDFEEKESILRKIIQLVKKPLNKNEKIREVEEHDEAIRILHKFSYKDECIVCDTSGIDVKTLLSHKEVNKEKIYQELDEDTKKILENIILLTGSEDPFKIKSSLIDAIKIGNKEIVEGLVEDIKAYLTIFNLQINNLFANCLADIDLVDKNNEYNKMLENKPELSDEDIMFIESIVNENIEKDIELKRDENNNLKLLLNDKEFLNQDRKNLHLSNGEQNFISLAFELIKAKNSNKRIIVLDDPISSFDSIYKNKITYSIIKFLEGKKQIVLTHNTELIKLMEHQRNKCFNLYLFNNTFDEENGFIKVNNKEQEILLYLDKLLDLFRNDIFVEVENERNFLISMIPFMRGYAQIINYKNEKNILTKLMHGYQEEKVDITEVYNNLFDTKDKITTSYEISAKDILSLDISMIDILKENSQYPLLNKTLRHTLTYLFLRLNVEKVLVDLFNINTKKNDMLSKIISKSFSGDTPENKKNRIFLLSRKTLLNEFNHFEGNMNIFQPAIDISDTALKKEGEDIIKFLSNLNLSPVGT